MTRMNWKRDVIPKVVYKLEHEYTFSPTVRGMFYNLVSDRAINNTFGQYKGLDRALSWARQKGLIAMDAFVDNTRKIVDTHNDKRWSPQEVIAYYRARLNNLKKEYFSLNYIPRWDKQNHYVEVWLEKDAVKGMFESILQGREVVIVPNRGWSSLSFKNENVKRLLTKQEEGKIVHGDFDPSGLAMDKNLARDLGDALGYDTFDFKRIALTKSQIRSFGLEHLKNPDPDVLKKLRQDSNRHSFITENGELYQIEIDALQKDPERFKQLVLSPVDGYFDQHIYDGVMTEFTPQYIEKLVHNQVQFSENEEDEDLDSEDTPEGER